jgi:hypothetical protein
VRKDIIALPDPLQKHSITVQLVLMVVVKVSRLVHVLDSVTLVTTAVLAPLRQTLTNVLLAIMVGMGLPLKHVLENVPEDTGAMQVLSAARTTNVVTKNITVQKVLIVIDQRSEWAITRQVEIQTPPIGRKKYAQKVIIVLVMAIRLLVPSVLTVKLRACLLIPAVDNVMLDIIVL